jgi:hypothetical protein
MLRRRPLAPVKTCARSLRGQAGMALMAALMVIVLMAIIITAAVTAGLSTFRSVEGDYRGTRAFYAAEAGAEGALSQIENALRDGVLSDEELAAIQPPELDGFSFADFKVERDQELYVETIPDGPFAGLYSLTQRFNVFSQATDPSGSHASVILGGKAQAIPIFQFGWFYGGNGQFGAGNTWDGYGRAHANGDLFLIGCDSYFHEPVTTAGKVHRDGITVHRPLGGGVNMCPIQVYIDDAASNAVFLNFDSDDTPDPEQFKAKSATYFDTRLMTEAHGVDSLRLPLPQGVPPREIIRPRDADDTDAEKDIKYSWLADMYVTVNMTTLEDKDVACGSPPPSNVSPRVPRITVTRSHGYAAVPAPQDECKIFQFRWESFFDNHEDGFIDVLDVDIGALRNWIELGSGDGTEIVYIEFLNADATPVEPGETDQHNFGNFQNAYHPVVKLIDGARLPGPLTIGAERTVYVQGDYNTIDWQPAAIFADVWGQLSNAWDDSHVQTDEDFSTWWCRFQMPRCPPASDTEQNHAVIVGSAAGILDCFHEDPSCPPEVILPSGEPRKAMGAGKMLEAWRHTGYSPWGVPACTGPSYKCTHRWRGSVVALWAPETSTPWYNAPAANYYYPPDRDHAFDTRFQNPENLPPGTPVVGNVLRAAFREQY